MKNFRIRIWPVGFVMATLMPIALTGATSATAATSKLPTCSTANLSKPATTTHHTITGGQIDDVSWHCTSYEFLGSPGSTYTYGFDQAGVTVSVSTVSLSLQKVAGALEDFGITAQKADTMFGFATGKLVAGSNGTLVQSHTANSAPIIGFACARFDNDAGNATGEACDVLSMEQREDKHGMYLGDHFTTTGQDANDGWMVLSGLQGWDKWTKGSQIVAWAPDASINPSACGSQTVGISANQDPIGVSMSESWPICPDSLSPLSSSPIIGQGALWAGCSKAMEGAPETDLVHIPKHVKPKLTVKVKDGVDDACG